MATAPIFNNSFGSVRVSGCHSLHEGHARTVAWLVGLSDVEEVESLAVPGHQSSLIPALFLMNRWETDVPGGTVMSR